MMSGSDHPIALWLDAHAPAPTAAAAEAIASEPPFDATEASAMLRAVPSRRDEFHTGRRLARTALAQLGCASVAIPIDKDRAPVWPPGFLGSISHSRHLCVAQVARSRDLLGIGVDIEPDTALSGDMAAQICLEDETGDGLDPMLRFVAKEAFYKAYFPATRTFLDFQDVHVVFDARQERFEARIVADGKPGLAGRRTFEGRGTRLAGHLVAACWIRNPAPHYD